MFFGCEERVWCASFGGADDLVVFDCVICLASALIPSIEVFAVEEGCVALRIGIRFWCGVGWV